MATSILEQIAQNLVTTLGGIQQGAGYDNSVTVERPNPKLGSRRRNNLLVLVQGNPERVQEDQEDFFHVYWLQPFSVVCYVIESEDSDLPIDARLNSLVADVQKIVLQDINRGMLAEDTDVGDPIFDALPEDLVATHGEAIVPIFVTYRVARTDPYSQTGA